MTDAENNFYAFLGTGSSATILEAPSFAEQHRCGTRPMPFSVARKHLDTFRGFISACASSSKSRHTPESNLTTPQLVYIISGV
jgi:hypothetical protein